MDNKLLVGISAIGEQKASATQRTNEAIDQILDYCALTLLMAFSIALAIWSSARIQTQDFTMRAKDEADLERIFSFLKMTPWPVGMGLY